MYAVFIDMLIFALCLSQLYCGQYGEVWKQGNISLHIDTHTHVYVYIYVYFLFIYIYAYQYMSLSPRG